MKKLISKMTSTEKKIGAVCLVFLFGFMGIGTAAWVLQHDSGITGLVISSEAIDFTDDFSMINIDTTDSGFTRSQSVNISNPDGEVLMSVNMTTLIQDVNDGCSNDGDIEITATYDNQEVSDGDNITIVSGLSQFDIQMDVVSRACPQNASVELKLIEA